MTFFFCYGSKRPPYIFLSYMLRSSKNEENELAALKVNILVKYFSVFLFFLKTNLKIKKYGLFSCREVYLYYASFSSIVKNTEDLNRFPQSFFFWFYLWNSFSMRKLISILDFRWVYKISCTLPQYLKFAHTGLPPASFSLSHCCLR